MSIMSVTARRAAQPIPAELRATFLHLYWDIAWFGITSGSAIAFAAVYATRLGADALQIGLMSAGPAFVGLLVTLPAARWLESRPLGKTVFWTAVIQRLGYLSWILLPIFFAPAGQVWMLIGLTLLMSIPATPLAVGFNALYASAVPPEWRGHVVGIRNALLAATYIASSLACGFLLQRLPFTLGYQVVFAIGFVGAMLSCLHLWYVRPASEAPPPVSSGRSLGDMARPGVLRGWGDGVSRSAIGLRFLARGRGAPLLRTEILRGRYGYVVAALFAFHLAQFLAIPLFPLYWVEVLHLTDFQIGLGTALFYVAMFLGSTQLSRFAGSWGNHRLAVIGALTMALYPLMTAASRDLGMFLLTSVVGGLSWSFVGGALANYLLERVPEDDRPAHLALYHLGLNAGVLLGSLGGPFLAAQMGLVTALVLTSALRLLAALLIQWWGR